MTPALLFARALSGWRAAVEAAAALALASHGQQDLDHLDGCVHEGVPSERVGWAADEVYVLGLFCRILAHIHLTIEFVNFDTH